MALARMAALKKYFRRDDAQAPGGGREVTMPELKALSSEEWAELAKLAAKELGEELAVSGTNG